MNGIVQKFGDSGSEISVSLDNLKTAGVARSGYNYYANASADELVLFTVGVAYVIARQTSTGYKTIKEYWNPDGNNAVGVYENNFTVSSTFNGRTADCCVLVFK